MINGQKFICLDDKAFELYNRGYSLVNKLDEFNEVYFKEIKAKCSNLNALPLIVIEMIRKHNYDNLVDIYDNLELEIIYNNKKRYELVTLVSIPFNDSKYKEIPLNTKLGLAIYNKKIGSSFSYYINDMKVSGKINSKIDNKVKRLVK